MNVTVIVNERSGPGAGQNNEQVRELEEAFARQDLEAEIRPAKGSELAGEAGRAVRSGADAVVAAGGDGTVSAVASVLAETGTGTPLGVLPMGTLNHFAKDLDIPLETDEAIRVIRSGNAISVDTGMVNNHFFINNSSIGVYPWVVRQREAGNPRNAVSKWMAMAGAWASSLVKFPLIRVRLSVDKNHAMQLRTPFIFIGNNEYQIQGEGFGGRKNIQSGRLCMYTMRNHDRSGILRLALGMLNGTMADVDHFEMQLADRLRIESDESVMQVALDGEVISVETPLEYSINRGSLNVLVPGNKNT